MANLKINLTPKIIDLALYAGDGVNIRVTVKDPNDDPVNLIGEVQAQIRPSRGSEDPASAEFSVDLTDATNGVFLLSLTREQTQSLATTTPFKGVWDVQWIPTGGQPRTFFQGKVEVVPDVTH